METYGFSRLRTFQLCPKKHDYAYTQGIKTKGNINLELGLLFHQCLEGHYSNNFELIQDALDKYDNLIKSGKIDLEPDLLSYVFTKYTRYYADQDKDEDVLCVETEFTDDLGPDEQFLLRVDRVVYNKETRMYILRDTKTTLKKLKYTFDDVNYNAQLLTYVPFIEANNHIKIDQIEIDEVRLAKLVETPLNANGKPTADKHRLELTTYENYVETLDRMGLTGEKAYFGALQYMQSKGHPLFNRVSAQILDPLIVQSNLSDIYDTYNAVKAGATFRNRGPLCNYCDYKDLCKFDMYSTDENIRQVEIEKIIDIEKDED